MPIGNCDWGLNALQIRQVSACTNLVLAVKQCLRVLPLALNSARKGNRLAIVLPLCCPSTCRGESGGSNNVCGRLQMHRLECHCTVAIFGVATIFTAAPARAQNFPWCAIMDNDGNTQCNYSTFQQCLQTLSGIGGRCVRKSGGQRTAVSAYAAIFRKCAGAAAAPIAKSGSTTGA